MNMLTVFLIAFTLQQPDRFPAPDRGEVRSATKEVRGIFKRDFAKKGVEAQRALAQKLLSAAEEVKDNTMRFALLAEARDVAAAASDMDAAVQAAQKLVWSYKVDTVKEMTAILPVARRGAKTQESVKAFGTACLRTARSLMASEEYVTAEAFAKEAAGAARSVRDKRTMAIALQTATSAAALEKDRKRVLDATELLLQKDDPGARLTVGRHLCFVKGDWTAGVGHLAGSSDKDLRRLAAIELLGASTVEEHVAIGDAWQKDAPRGRGGVDFRMRARYWYERAKTKAKALQLPGLDTMISKLPIQGTEIDLLSLMLPSEATGQPWRFDGDALVAGEGFLALPYSPPSDYDVTVTVRRTGGRGYFLMGLVGDGGVRFIASMNGFLGGMSGLELIDGKNCAENVTRYEGALLLPDADHTIIYRVRQRNVRVEVNGVTVVDWVAAWDKLSVTVKLPHARRDVLFIGSVLASWKVSKATVTPFSGRGRVGN